MVLRPVAVLDGKLRAAVQAAEAHDASLLDPSRLFLPHFDRLHGAFSGAQPAADAGVLHVEIGRAPHPVVIKRPGDQLREDRRGARPHMAVRAAFAHALYHAVDLRFRVLCVFCDLFRGGKVKSRRPGIRHLNGIIGIDAAPPDHFFCHRADRAGRCAVSEAIRNCLDYGKNPEKTENGKYISSYECDPATVAAEFLLAKASYKAMTGREQKQGEDVLCYQIRQSFYPGEITPEEANQVSYELAMRWTKGRHAFIVTTHTDKEHIHSHIYYNSTTLDCTRKFRNFWGSSFALRRLSDRLCLENGLSIVENPKPRSKGKFRNYGEWLAGRKRPLTYQDRLRAVIDTALAKRPADFPEFLSLMEQAGYEVKQRRGAVSFRAPGQERFTRLRSDTLGDGYGEADIRAAISGSRQRPGQPRQKVSLAIDIQSRLQGKGPGYERWAKVFNLKQMAAALAYLQDNGLTDYEQLEQKATAAAERFHKLSDQIKSTEAALHTNMELKAATVQYAKTRPVFEKYKASKYSRKFLAEHEADIELYRAACADFKRILDGGKLPKMDALKEEGRKLAEQKKKLYAEYRKAKADMQEVTTIKANIDYLLGYSEPGRKKEQER